MVIDYEGKSYEIAFEDITVRQAMIIHRETGLTMARFREALFVTLHEDEDRYLETLGIIYWLMTGGTAIMSRLDFKIVGFARALQASSKEAVELDLAKQRRNHNGKTDEEYWAERAAIAETLPFADQIEIKKHYQGFGQAQKWFDEWFDQNIKELRGQWMWDFGDVLSMSAHDIDGLCVTDFFFYCNCLRQYREAEKRRAREAEEKNAQQAAMQRR